MPAANVEELLVELCVKLGFCLPPADQRRLIASPPPNPDAFADAVFIAEGMDPCLHKHLRRRVLEIIARHWTTDTSRQ